jgi:hypothetical protein
VKDMIMFFEICRQSDNAAGQKTGCA